MKTHVFLLIVTSTIEIITFVGFWKGRNWARILILIGCGLEFAAFPFIGRLLPLARVYSVGHIIFVACLVYWLTRKPVVAFFKAPGDATSKPDEIAPVSASFSL